VTADIRCEEREETIVKSRTIKTVAVIVLLLVVVTAWQALAQPGAGGGQPPGGGFAGMMGPGWPPVPTPVVVVSDGVVYVACDGKLIAYEAKTLKLLAEATYWEREAE
jgi:hypothetical protein